MGRSFVGSPERIPCRGGQQNQGCARGDEQPGFPFGGPDRGVLVG